MKVKKTIDEQIKELESKKQKLLVLREKELSKGMKYVIVRTYSAGVFAGNLFSKKGKEVILKDARRLWYWDGAASLSQLSIDGVSKPENCKFPKAVPEVILTEAIEILPVSSKAEKIIKSVPVWECDND
jgi:hypothetical protein